MKMNVKETILYYAEMVQDEFTGMEFEELYDKTWDALQKNYEFFFKELDNDYDRWDYLVDWIILDKLGIQY